MNRKNYNRIEVRRLYFKSFIQEATLCNKSKVLFQLKNSKDLGTTVFTIL